MNFFICVFNFFSILVLNFLQDLVDEEVRLVRAFSAAKYLWLVGFAYSAHQYSFLIR